MGPNWHGVGRSVGLWCAPFSLAVDADDPAAWQAELVVSASTSDRSSEDIGMLVLTKSGKFT